MSDQTRNPVVAIATPTSGACHLAAALRRPGAPLLPTVTVTTAAAASDDAAGSRRRRLWEMDAHAHCPVIGVCLPIAAVQKLARKIWPRRAFDDDYELHCAVVNECRRRTPIAEAVQSELDRRYAVPLGQAIRCRQADDLARWWTEQGEGSDTGAALWATLTHPRVTRMLECRVLGQVHMLQHQAGMRARMEQDRVEALQVRHTAAMSELDALRQRCRDQATQHARRAQELLADNATLRAQLALAHEAANQARARQAGVDAQPKVASSDDGDGDDRSAHDARLHDRIRTLEHALEQARRKASRDRQRLAAVAARLNGRGAPSEATSHGTGEAIPLAEVPPVEIPLADVAQVRLDDQSILCVGGRTAAVPLYRHLVERTGARFLHHDGGTEDGSAQLDATMAAADLVICQTGCISHDAYWRVKDHCRRTGKRCVFVETPSTARLKRALIALAPPTEPQASQVGAA